MGAKYFSAATLPLFMQEKVEEGHVPRIPQ